MTDAPSLPPDEGPHFDPPSEEEVLGLLRGVMDPELGDNIVDLGMVRGASVSPEGVATVTIALTTAGCPLRASIKSDVELRVERHPGVRSVRLEWDELTQEERSRVMERARLSARENAPDTEVPAATRVVAISSGKGGVGKSSVAANLAVAVAAQGYTVGVLDADIWGFSLPRMLGMEGRLEVVRDEDDGRGKIVPHERPVGAGLLKVVSTGFLVDEESTALMWRGLMLTKALEQFLRDVRWGDMDYLLVDMPPGTGDVQMALARLLPQAEMVVVTTPAVSAQKVAVRAADMARRSHMPIVGVIENMSAFVCEHGERYELFGAGGGQRLSEEIGAPLLGQVPLEPAVASGSDEGAPVALAGTGPAAEAFGRLADVLTTEAAPPVDMSGCTARLLEAAERLLPPDDAPARSGP